jgi:hypothetical protein
VALLASAEARLLRAFAAQVETMRRLRNGGTQVIRVEMVEVSDTAQEIYRQHQRATAGVLRWRDQQTRSYPCNR